MQLKGYEKAAIFLSAIGEEAASEILKNLDISEVSMIALHMSRLKGINKTVVDEVFKEASEKISKGILHLGGEEYVKNILNKGFGEEGAEKVLDLASKEDAASSLKGVDTKTLSNFLMAEHPQTKALVISLLEPAQAAEVLSSMPEDVKADVAMRIAATERIPESAIEEILEILRGHMDVSKNKGRKLGGAKTIAEILNHCDKATEQAVLEKIETYDDNLADTIRKFMFIFDDLIYVDDRGIQTILKEVSIDELSIALKTASEALKEKIFKNMSQRAAQILKEEMQSKGPVRVSDVEKAQQNIVKIARKLEAEGKIIIAGRGGEELVV